MPRGVGVHPWDVINHVHRQAGVIQSVVDKLEVLQPVVSPPLRARRPDAKMAAEAVFGSLPVRDRSREIVSVKGRRVRVVERGNSNQMALPL